jgi:replicative DNA helicase
VTQSHDIEAALLGGLLLSPKSVAEVADLVTAEDFHAAAHRLIYAAVTALDAKGKAADFVTVSQHLQAQGQLDDVGGLPALGELARSTGSAANVKAYAERVRDLSLERQLLERTYSAQQILQDAGTTAEKVDAVQRLFLDVGAKQGEGPRSAKECLPEMLDHIERMSQQKGAITGLATGFADLDQKTSGLQPGDLVIIAARPSMGKTTLAMNIAEHVALGLNKPVLVFSMEMSIGQLLLRMSSSISRVPFEHIKAPALMREEDWPRLMAATGRMAEAKLHIDDGAALTVAQVRARARRLKQREGLGLIVVDYLQLMQAPGHKDKNRTSEITEISRGLKLVAKELGVPLIALSQLNRSLEQRPNKRPVMSDLRESGAIEQDADLIAFIYRDEVYHELIGDNDARRGIAEIIIGKQRNGSIGKVHLAFQGQFVRFDNCDHESLKRYREAEQQREQKPRRYAKGGFE